MTSISPAFAFDVPAEPLVLAAARSLTTFLGAGELVTRKLVSEVLTVGNIPLQGVHLASPRVAGTAKLRWRHTASDE